MNLSTEVKLTKVKVASAAAQTAINSDSVDMAGWEGVLFFTTVLAITSAAVTSINAAQAITSGGSYADLLGTKVAIADDDDNQTFFLDIYRPREQFVRLEVARATQDSAFGEIYALQYGAKKRPYTQNVTDKVTGELHVSPAEGTA